MIFCGKCISAKAAHKMCLKLTTGVNFINIKRADFSFESDLNNLQFGFVIFSGKNIGAKA